MSAARPFLVVLVGLVLVACGPPAKEDTTFHNTDVTGTWDVYRTYTGGPEQGPDAAAFTNVVSGFGVRAQFACSSHVLPSGHMAIAGELHGTALTLSSSDATYVGTVTGASMEGEFADSTIGSGTWRAQKVPAAKCKTYEVWGGDAFLCGTDAYTPEAYGFTLLGTGTTTQTFEGSYLHYVVVTRDQNQVHVDAVETPNGSLLPSVCEGNPSSASPGTLASVDAAGIIVGRGSTSAGGYLQFDPSTAPTSLKVWVVP